MSLLVAVISQTHQTHTAVTFTRPSLHETRQPFFVADTHLGCLASPPCLPANDWQPRLQNVGVNETEILTHSRYFLRRRIPMTTFKRFSWIPFLSPSSLYLASRIIGTPQAMLLYYFYWTSNLLNDLRGSGLPHCV